MVAVFLLNAPCWPGSLLITMAGEDNLWLSEKETSDVTNDDDCCWCVFANRDDKDESKSERVLLLVIETEHDNDGTHKSR